MTTNIDTVRRDLDTYSSLIRNPQVQGEELREALHLGAELVASHVPDLIAEVEQWRATYGENALRDAQRIIAERDRLIKECAAMLAVVRAAEKWRAQFSKPADTKFPRMRALIEAVDALPNKQEPCGICSGYGCPDCREDLSGVVPASSGQVWSAPAEPDVEKVRDRHGREWTRSTYTKSSPRWWRGEPGASIPHTWHELLADYGPLTEAVAAEAVNGR